MKKLILIVIVFIAFPSVFAQKKKTDLWDEFERVYPWYGFTFNAGVGTYPYGLPSISEGSKKSSSLKNPLFSEYLELSYVSKKLPIGVFISVSLNQFHKSSDWSPFDWYSKLPDYQSGRIGQLINIKSNSNSFNTGILFGREVIDGFEIYAKIGVGNSWHNYEVTYTEAFNMNNRIFGNYKTQSLNYQAAIDFRFFPMPIVGFSGSIGISDNFPVFTLSSAWKFGYKTRKKNQS